MAGRDWPAWLDEWHCRQRQTMSSPLLPPKKRVAFLHPDLGIGALRLRADTSIPTVASPLLPFTNAFLLLCVRFPSLALCAGGAERLVVDAALALQQNGFEVVFFTSHHDPQHCFRETADGTLPVRVYGDFLPRSIFGRCAAACAYLRSLWAACCLLVGAAFAAGSSGAFDAIIVDSISISIPLLCLFGRHRVRMQRLFSASAV
jgi:alpha-1,3/alpha-1,6-mannosyltransferase